MDIVESNSVDVVVSTLVFCSVDNLKKILQQILRVLTPVSISLTFYVNGIHLIL